MGLVSNGTLKRHGVASHGLLPTDKSHETCIDRSLPRKFEHFARDAPSLTGDDQLVQRHPGQVRGLGEEVELIDTQPTDKQREGFLDVKLNPRIFGSYAEPGIGFSYEQIPRGQDLFRGAP